MIKNNTEFNDEQIQIIVDKLSSFSSMFLLSPVELADIIESRDIRRFVEAGILTGKDWYEHERKG